MLTIQSLLKTRKASTEEALQIFDGLPAVDSDFMLGRWKGSEVDTGHPMDGLLELTGWYGKLFVNKDEVHPLLFYTKGGKSLYAVNPQFIPLNIKIPKWKIWSKVMQLLKPILKTKKTTARLRMMTCRGKLTATMIYDNKAIFDHFVKIDDNTVLGLMDLKGSAPPYFWIMKRDDSSTLNYLF